MGIGDWGLGPIPNPQSPIPIYNKLLYKVNKYFIIYFLLLNYILLYNIIIFFKFELNLDYLI